MEGFSLKGRAIAFAACTGAVSFILALAATSHGNLDVQSASTAVIAAIVCGVMCWASAERALAHTAGAIDAAIERMAGAAKGDLESAIPPEVTQHVPPLASAMGALFQQIHANLDRVERLAMFDSVTDLPNRTHFRDSFEELLTTLAPAQSAGLYFIDLDRFKSVNDTLGHACGDMLLRMVADRLRAVADHVARDASRSPLIGRLAGDEFTMFFPELPDRDPAQIGQGILHALCAPFTIADQEVEIGASIGVALYPLHGTTLTELMRAADAAMYRAKANGRGRIELFDDALASELAERVQLESDLRSAVERQQFELVYQPQVSASDGRIVAAEALLRWRHPDGLRMPADFLQRAEETGLIVEIGEWVIDHVARTISRWAALGIQQRMSVNISARQLDHASFFRGLRQAMLAASAPARLLELELSEALTMRCSPEVLEAIAALRRDGASIAVDDFGTGYSNLARLRELPIDRVKLDRSLIEHVADHAEARTIAQAVIGLVHGLGCEAVAEGIESQAQADVLRVIGCDVLQGYALGRPMAEAEFLAWARTDIRQRAAS